MQDTIISAPHGKFHLQFCLGQSLTISPGWPLTHHAPASVSQRLPFQTCYHLGEPTIAMMLVNGGSSPTVPSLVN